MSRHGTEMVEVRFPSVLPCGMEATDTVTARLFSTADSDWKLPVVLLHGMAFSRLRRWDSFAAALSRRGFPVLLVCLPFVCERTPPAQRGGGAYTGLGTSALPAYEQAVADARAALDWLLAGPVSERAGTGGSRASIVGVSLGAFIAVIAAALEARFTRVVCALAGADLDAVVFGGTYGPRIRLQMARAGITSEQRESARIAYREYLMKVRRADHPLDVPAPLQFFLYDPMTFAHHLAGRLVLQLNAVLDPVIPMRAARQLRSELGTHDMCWLWGTHWLGGPWRPFVTRRIARFLRASASEGQIAGAPASED